MCRTDVILKKISDLQFVQSMEPVDMEHQLCSANSSPGFVVGFLLSPSRYSQAAFFPQPLTSSPCLLCFKVQPSLHWQHHLPGSSQMTCLLSTPLLIGYPPSLPSFLGLMHLTALCFGGCGALPRASYCSVSNAVPGLVSGLVSQGSLPSLINKYASGSGALDNSPKP